MFRNNVSLNVPIPLTSLFTSLDLDLVNNGSSSLNSQFSILNPQSSLLTYSSFSSPLLISTPIPSHTRHAPLANKLTTPHGALLRPSPIRTNRNQQIHFLHDDINTRPEPTTTHTGRRVSLPCALFHIACEILEHDVRDGHVGGADEGAVVAGVLGDGWAEGRALEVEVLEEDVADGAPSTTSR